MRSDDDVFEMMQNKIINPKNVFDSTSFETKGIITKGDQLSYACSYALQNTNDNTDIEGNFINGFADLLRTQLLILSRSVDGRALSHYVTASSARIGAEDRKTKITVEGESQ